MNVQKTKQKTYSAVQIAQMAAACALSWQLAKFAGSTHPYLAPLSVILCMQTSGYQTLSHSRHRMIGTVIGCIIIELLNGLLKPNAWTIGLLIFAGLWAAKALKRNEVVSEQVALTIMLVFVFEHKTGHYIVDRLRDTAIGTLLAVVMHLYVLPPNRNKQLRKALVPFTSQMSAWFSGAAAWLQRGCQTDEGTRLKEEMKAWRASLQKLEQTIKEIGKVRKFYPFSSRKFELIHGYQTHWERWRRGFFYMEGALSQIEQWHQSGGMTALDHESWTKQFHVIGSYYSDLTDLLTKSAGKLPELPFVYFEPIPLQVAPSIEEDHSAYGIALYQNTKDFLQELQAEE